MKEIKIHHNKVAEAFELQTNEKPVKFVAAVFHQKDDVRRLNSNEAEKLAHLFAAAPALLEACKAWEKYDSKSFDKHPYPDSVMRKVYLKEARKLTEVAIALAEKE
jgi:hypothetical protein